MIEEGSTGDNKIDTGNDQEEIYKLAFCLGPTKLKKILTELEHLEEEKVSESWFTSDNLNIFLSQNNSNKIIYVFLLFRESLSKSHKVITTTDSLSKSHKVIATTDSLSKSHKVIATTDSLSKSHKVISTTDSFSKSHKVIPTTDSLSKSHKVIATTDSFSKSHKVIATSINLENLEEM